MFLSRGFRVLTGTTPSLYPESVWFGSVSELVTFSYFQICAMEITCSFIFVLVYLVTLHKEMRN
jgi:hypothetical protein